MKLHLGCGEKILENFINIDSRPLYGVNIVSDISELKNIQKLPLETFENHVNL